MILLVGGGEHLALVDHVNADLLEHLGFDEMADTHLPHNRDRDRIDDLRHLRGIGHPRHASRLSDIRRDALEGHDRNRSCLFRDDCLLCIDDVHDDPALLHGGKSPLDQFCTVSQFLKLHCWYL